MATVIVVPIPEAAASFDARSCTRRFASWISCDDAALAAAERPLSFIAAAARLDASSPACAPPMPSATPKSGGRTTYASSLRRRLRPVSESPASLLDPHGSNLMSVSPMRTTSPGVSRRSRVRRMPFTNVPFVDPMSSM